MIGLRNLLFDSLRADPMLTALGIREGSVFAGQAPDSPAGSLQRWVVLRWGIESPTLGRDTTARRKDLSVWAYDTDPDYAAIVQILSRICDICKTMEGKPAGTGWVIGVVDNGYSEDLPAVEYAAVTKNWNATFAVRE